ncbi:response regulator [Rahnella sp. C60]|uniref:Response regulator n=1 Tax=Rahnella perminowiae TaxID=2816244 RepID=A0ABS6L3P6_9GAMM|nr:MULTISPECIES: response regulator [Rahnella]MBU9816306.1 response regulator [Rahnella perminowiae]MBU9836466.1 response regulator [Rahnella perminowiae]MCR9003438.1 response regulator [Rahnella perminowiae]MCX2942188.1 response regulator [Rahnella perminowiae]
MYNIVIVEDELIESESLRRIVSESVGNSIVHEASTGKKAIQLIDKLDQIDMMLVDINIPLPNGNQVIEYLRTKSASTKVIVTTANDDFDLVRSMLNLKVDDYLLKPVKKSTLTDAIRKTLDVSDVDIVASRALKQTVGTMIERCDYPQWHNFLFDALDNTCAATPSAISQRKILTDVLELMHQHLISWGEKGQPAAKTVTALIQEISQSGISASTYYRIMSRLLSIGETVFDHALKHFTGSMSFIDRAKFHIEKNILDNLTLDDIAARSFVSSCYLSRAFKKMTGAGFSNYIAGRKINVAKSLLQCSDLRINTIALELSWQDANYFCRIFKKETGMAPSDFRKIVAPVPA